MPAENRELKFCASLSESNFKITLFVSGRYMRHVGRRLQLINTRVNYADHSIEKEEEHKNVATSIQW